MPFYFIRHAQKETGDFYNTSLRHQDEPITAKGREQAQNLIAFFTDKQISAIYVSAYLRTLQTSEPLAKQLGLSARVDQRLNEVDNGLIEGLTDQQIQERHPEVWKGFVERKADFRFPQGESGEEARRRLADFLEEKIGEHGNENILIVSHEALIRLLMCHLMNIPVYKRWNFHVDFCGITEITYQRELGEWKLIRFNQT